MTPAKNSPIPGAERPRRRRILSLVSKREAARVSRLLRAEVVGGVIVMIAALLGFLAANSPIADSYFALRDTKIGPASLGLNINVGHWASDGLLAIFFFMVGLELKREFVSGALSKFSTAIVPVAAAFGGVAVPALLYVSFTAGTPAAHGWAIPTATDIAFAVAVLGLIAPRIPPALRMFLLTLAVVDDLIAITIIAVFYTENIQLLPLVLSVIPLALYWFISRKYAARLARSTWGPWLILLPLGMVAWALFHASGIHATIAGVVLAFLVPVSGRDGTQLAETFEHRFRPLSTGIAVPVFAFFAAGVAVGGASRFPLDPIALGIMVGLVIGKPVGISLITWLLTRFTRAELDPAVRWRELIGVAALAGVGFTVSLLVTELSFSDAGDADTARLAVMVGSVIAVAVSAALLVRKARPRAVAAQETE
ncbi:Na+/H+ antiporter NhaA [Leucobacter chromiireducens]|uniref:Na(+)/H(+) antiporter NhaA n=1 Tax=Leucobacter chromiireducens subsp. chromiireducens TaxID=660067 RepID=A0ABS1SM25_9MICO|nr:Na+/H+ antiporter NhaA [Leucobacter chromiireducens]MBL3689227.1 Na+/H+ antiporter NhaA [Leucobacter chromiireducens subsp. chromiireducens]